MAQKKKLADILLEKGMLSQEQLEQALAEQESTGVPIQKILLDKKLLSPEKLAEALAEQLGIPYVKLRDINIDPQVIKMVPENVALKYKAVPVNIQENDLYIATSTPLNLPAIDEIKLVTGCQVKPMITTDKDIEQAINKYFKVEDTSKQALIDMRLEKLREKEKEGKKEKAVSIEEKVGKIEDFPVVRLVNNIIEGAINAKASDIHLEGQVPEMRVRYRIDGILHDVMNVPKHIEASVVSRIKIMANMDITERRHPQDGHITINRGEKVYDFRVSSVLTINGEKIVMRILDKAAMLISLDKLGLSAYDEEVFRALITKPYGMILVTGPTGSGKTTTLYAVLSQMNAKASNIITIEEPVEYKLEGINQIQVDPLAKITFATGLRTIFRQDPDIIMVGEIRDRETAEIAIQAALTGHLVFSTLHTNDAPRAVTRLIDMAIEPFLISSTVIGIIAQRLCRTICPECKQEYDSSEQELQELRQTRGQRFGSAPSEGEGNPAKGLRLARGNGCDFCYRTGFKGRSGIFEIMRVSDNIRKRILEKRPAAELRELAIKEGMKTLKQNGILKVINGVSTFDEVKRVVYVGEED